MRVVVGSHGRLSTWFQDPIRASSVRNSFTLLGERAIVGMPRPTFLQLLSRENMTETEKQLLSYWFSKEPRIAIVQEPYDYDLLIGDTFEDGNDLQACLDSRKFADVFEARRSSPPPGEPNDEAFLRLFSKLLPISRKMVLVDKYFFNSFTKNFGDSELVLSKILKLNGHAHFYTCADDFSASKDKFERRISSVRRLKNQLQSHAKVTVTVLNADMKSFLHDRVGYFQFERGRVPFALGKGVATFDHKSQNQPRAVGNLEGMDVNTLDIYLRSFKPFDADGDI